MRGRERPGCDEQQQGDASFKLRFSAVETVKATVSLGISLQKKDGGTTSLRDSMKGRGVLLKDVFQ